MLGRGEEGRESWDGEQQRGEGKSDSRVTERESIERHQGETNSKRQTEGENEEREWKDRERREEKQGLGDTGLGEEDWKLERGGQSQIPLTHHLLVSRALV